MIFKPFVYIWVMDEKKLKEYRLDDLMRRRPRLRSIYQEAEKNRVRDPDSFFGAWNRMADNEIEIGILSYELNSD
jgi:hypothetical protein